MYGPGQCVSPAGGGGLCTCVCVCMCGWVCMCVCIGIFMCVYQCVCMYLISRPICRSQDPADVIETDRGTRGPTIPDPCTVSSSLPTIVPQGWVLTSRDTSPRSHPPVSHPYSAYSGDPPLVQRHISYFRITY